ncbi:DUF2058 domain-containing protein [Luteimonas sp. MJ246]|uniref:DUF2058 domain-containing protein n=1 Tax=Luteimonas sp. MJ174 TaxID=3129237 RepID=UPI0031BA824A
MAKANPLQEQLLKAGLVKKSKVAEVAREQHVARHARAAADAAPSEAALDAERARMEKAERDRILSAERKAQARTAELRAQARQIVQDKKLPRKGDSEYRFNAGGAIRTLLIDDEQRRMLASGALVIARLGDRHELLPRGAAEKVRERDPEMIVLDHGQAAGTEPAASTSEDDAYYARFEVPDDLVW